MTDIWDQSKRSEVMGLIRSTRNRSTELRLIECFRKNRIVGWRRGQKLPGKPDFVFREKRLCVFVDGCFWHGCPKCYRPPSSNIDYWSNKIERNKERDKLINRELRHRGWRVMRIWEHELRPKSAASLRRRLRRAGL